MKLRRQQCKSRWQASRAFTLVELLVVISIMAVLASLVIAFFPNAASAQREARAAMQLQGWLNMAKQRALRDQIPFGLRLIQGTTDPTQVTECQFIQQPDDFSGGSVVSAPPLMALPPTEYLVFALPAGTDLLNGYVPINPAEQRYWLVQPGDSIELFGSGLVRQIIAVDVNIVRVSPPLPNAINMPTANYRIIRSPRPAGDEKLSLPDSTVIDVGTNITYNNAGRQSVAILHYTGPPTVGGVEATRRRMLDGRSTEGVPFGKVLSWLRQDPAPVRLTIRRADRTFPLALERSRAKPSGSL